MRPCLLLLAALAACGGRRPVALTVSVAASLQDAMNDVARQYRAVPIDFNYGASGALARQIGSGAPVDVFFSAAAQPMDDLAADGLILAGTRRDVLRNQIVLVAGPGSAATSFESLASPEVKLIALGDPESVPAGEYGRQALTRLGLWDRIRPKLVLAKDVRQVAAYVATRNADAGIVYATDARGIRALRVVATAPSDSHDPIVYPVAVVRGSKSVAAARDFTAWLTGPEARAIFAARGFQPVIQ